VARLFNRFSLIFAGIGLYAAHAEAQMICYTNDNGVFTCGDSVPPEDARHDRQILNELGIKVREEQGEITPEERAVIEAEQRRQEEERLRIEEQQRYDQQLLDIFLSVDDIVSMRDRRIEVLDSRIRIIESLLGNLYTKLEGLRNRAGRFAPINENPDAPPIPENLALDLANTEASIDLREKMLTELQSDREEIQTDFDAQIRRFRQLKGLPPEESGIATG
jgi:hypothetical protein